ncbi:MAG TPA: Rrf2 family transcriptional regulator [Phycisphaerae bacterium]|nr:Rrf2 family transcriptional regulator [Phycisphaerae bacterium]
MNLSQKCQYALRALFELAHRAGQGPISMAEVAEAQAIPVRFLELILNQLKQPGWVESYRGIHGGYALVVEAAALSVGEVIRFIEGPLAPVKCIAGQGGRHCPLLNRCAFQGLWDRAERAISEVYDSTSFQDLLDEQAVAPQPEVLNYSI